MSDIIYGPIVETKAFEELGILVVDTSASMELAGKTGKRKAEEVSDAIRELVRMLKFTRYAFYLAIVAFGDAVIVRLPLTSLREIDDGVDFYPRELQGWKKALGDAMEVAGTIAREFIVDQTGVPRSVVIIVMSDFCCDLGTDPAKVAELFESIPRKVAVYSAGFGRGEVDEVMLRLVGRDGYARTPRPEDLRMLFEHD